MAVSRASLCKSAITRLLMAHANCVASMRFNTSANVQLSLYSLLSLLLPCLSSQISDFIVEVCELLANEL
jgi:hypothetical protein